MRARTQVTPRPACDGSRASRARPRRRTDAHAARDARRHRRCGSLRSSNQTLDSRAVISSTQSLRSSVTVASFGYSRPLSPVSATHRALYRATARNQLSTVSNSTAAARCATSTRSATTCCIVATDRISAFDYVLGRAFRTRAKCSRSCRRSGSSGWATSCRTTSSPPTSTAFPRRRSRTRDCCAAAAMLVPPHAAAADRVRRARLPVGLRLEGIPADRQRLRRHAARRAAGVGPAARADLHAGDEGRDRPRHQHQRRRSRRRSSAADSSIASRR